MAFEKLGQLNGVTLWLFLLSVVFGFFIKNQGLFAADFGSDLLRFFSFDLAKPFSLSGLTILSSFFVHLNLPHLLGNYAVILPVGIYLEKKLSKKFLLLFIFSSHILVLVCQLLIYSWFGGVGDVNGLEISIDGGTRYLLGSSAVGFSLLSLTLLRLKKLNFYFFFLFGYSAYAVFAASHFNSHIPHLIGWFIGSLIFYSFRRRLTD